MSHYNNNDGIAIVKENKKVWLALGIIIFFVYFFCAARPVPLETVLVPRWLVSLESGKPMYLGDNPMPGAEGEDQGQKLANSPPAPFELGSRFGFFDHDGNFSINQIKKAHVSLSAERWAEYDAEPENIAVRDSKGEVLTVIEHPRGYPFFLDNRTFLIGSEQNAISEIGDSGEILWTYEFSSPLTCVDAAAGLVLAGSLDGIAAVLDSGGKQVLSFEPCGSRYSIILGCAISRDGSRLALISGIDDQRFLLLERFGTSVSDYKVIYHEFLNGDFRRVVYISFIEEDRWIMFERNGGLGFFDLVSRQLSKVELPGDISAIDHSGGHGLVFAVVSLQRDAKELVGIRLPGRVIIEAPFKSEEVFLERHNSRLFIGGQQTMVSFDLHKK